MEGFNTGPIIDMIKNQMISAHKDELLKSGNGAQRVRKAHENYQQVGMYRVLAAEMADLLGKLAAVVGPALEGREDLAHITGLLKDWRQKCEYAAQSSMKSVSRQLFDGLVEQFQKPCVVVTMESEKPVQEEVFLLEAIWLDKASALEVFLQPVLGDDAPKVVKAMGDRLPEVFALIKAGTKGQYYPACTLKRVDMRAPGLHIYDTFMTALPMIMDQVYGAVLADVEQSEGK